MPEPSYQYAAELERVVDGDTVRLLVDLGFHVHVVEVFRLARIDCPEMVTIAGVDARNATSYWFSQHPNVLLTSTRTDRYGRWLAEIESRDGGQSLNDWLLENGHAQPWPKPQPQP